MQLLKLNILSDLKLLVSIILDNIANQFKDKLIEEDVRFDKLSSIILGCLLGNSTHQNATSFRQYCI